MVYQAREFPDWLTQHNTKIASFTISRTEKQINTIWHSGFHTKNKRKNSFSKVQKQYNVYPSCYKIVVISQNLDRDLKYFCDDYAPVLQIPGSVFGVLRKKDARRRLRRQSESTRSNVTYR
ncbi:unnamed protein product [Pieris brassicae]|uniref:Uncharacterized protein n=1 Tax=Pieris brassicae TaxID=7116 RepID=A0A9P0XF29_PIEBR|nr:unnamed protein product [Pieris brassicae]